MNERFDLLSQTDNSRWEDFSAERLCGFIREGLQHCAHQQSRNDMEEFGVYAALAALLAAHEREQAVLAAVRAWDAKLIASQQASGRWSRGEMNWFALQGIQEQAREALNALVAVLASQREQGGDDA